MVVYIRTQGARIMKEGRHLLVKKDKTTYHTLFVYKLQQLLLFGNIEITHSAMIQLMRHNIDTVFLTRDGRYLGRLASPESKNVFLHKKQYQLTDDKDFALKFSRNIVAGKLANMVSLLMRIKRQRRAAEAGKKAEQIQSLLRKLESAATIDSLRGYEGQASALYFEGFQHGFIKDMGFRKRSRRPPTDPVNSVMSLLYTFVMNRVYAGVRMAGLDPYPGFLHALDYGRYSLVLDLMEEMRTIIADTLTLSLFNLGILKHTDFKLEKPDPEAAESNPDQADPDVSKDPLGLILNNDDSAPYFDLPEQNMEKKPVSAETADGKYPVKLHEAAFHRVLDAFEKKLAAKFYHPRAERQLTYADAINFQAAHCRQVMEGEADAYQPLLLK